MLSYNPSGQLTQVADSAGSSSLGFTRDAGGRILSITQAPSGRSLTVSWTAPIPKSTGGCTAAVPPLVSEIDAPPPAVGQAPLRWTYQYTCAQLVKQCDATNACATYNATPTSGTFNDPYFETSRTGGTIDTLRDLGSYDNGSGYTQHLYLLPLPSGATRQIAFYQLNPNATTAQANQYGLWNQFLGPIAEWYDHELQNGVTPSDQDRPTLYMFDDLYRLRIQAKRTLYEAATRGSERDWNYSYTTGQFMAFLDENFNGFEVGFDGWGNYASKLGNIDPTTQNGVDNGHYDNQRSGDHTRVTNQMAWPIQAAQPSGWQNFYYDNQGRLDQRNGYPRRPPRSQQHCSGVGPASRRHTRPTY